MSPQRLLSSIEVAKISKLLLAMEKGTLGNSKESLLMRLRLKICGDNKIITNKANLLQGQYKFYNKLAKLKKKTQ